MSNTIYIAHLKSPFSRIEVGSKYIMVPCSAGAFFLRHDAERFIQTHFPPINPFSAVGLGAEQEGLEVWNATNDEEHFVAYRSLLETIEKFGIEKFEKLQETYSQEVEVWDSENEVIQIWRHWWDKTVSKMTDIQKSAFWEMIANGRPYNIIEIEYDDSKYMVELSNKYKGRIWAYKNEGFSIIGAMKQLCDGYRDEGINLRMAKEIVSSHPAYSAIHEAARPFHEAAMAAINTEFSDGTEGADD
jgi:hypothetical protein